MFKNAILFAFLTLSFMSAQSIEEIVNNVNKNNYDLKSMQNSILIASQEIKISQNWKNPILTFGVNDIQSSDPFSRDLEAMQARYIGFSQVIPIGNKLKLKKDLAIKQKDIEKLLFEDKKLQLKSKIYEYSYSILILEKKYVLLNEYEKNLVSLKELFYALYENSKVSQNSIFETDIKIAKIKIKKQNLKNLIDTLYLRLEELSYSKITKIVASLNILKKNLKQEFKTHPKFLMFLKNIEKSKDKTNLELAKKTSDVKFNIAYFSRDEKFEDYANFSFNIPLSLYGTENLKALKSKFKTKKMQDDLKILEQKFKTSIDILQNNINNSYLTYKLLEKTILPLKQKVQENLENYNSLDQINPQQSIKSLNEIISYELEALEQMNKYFSFVSKSIYFTQGL